MQVDFTSLSTFVWTKIGVEAGEKLNEILVRKENERLANGGTFLWGVGNNIGPSVRVLTKQRVPEILFSPICSVPRACDQTPDTVFRWTKAETLDGLPFVIPAGSIVTSIGYPHKRFHYALICHSADPIRLGTLGKIYAGSLRNLVSGKQVGSSQVTSVVERDLTRAVGREYKVTMRFSGYFPYFVRLYAPVPMGNSSWWRCSDPTNRELLNWNPAHDCVV